jgi:hypothetical protein
MVVKDYFYGDNDPSSKVSWIQHDVYQSSLRLIVSACLNHMKSGFMMVGQDYPKKWDREIQFDHRTLQLAHDLVAAAWRFDCLETEMPLFFQTDREVVIERKWKAWLQNELYLWRDQPAIVRNVIIVLGNQNTENGYHAEDLLTQALVNRFDNVDWHDWFLTIAYGKFLPPATLEVSAFQRQQP